MNTFRQCAQQIASQLSIWRRDLHQTPELNGHLPQTMAYITKCLGEMDISYQVLEKAGIIARIGKSEGKTFLLRADMDALPIAENSQETFCSENGNMHACGHDLHMAMLLGGCYLLKQQEDSLKGCVKVLFQCDEEGMTGAKASIAGGILQNPKVEAAMALHVLPGALPAGSYSAHIGSTTAAVDRFTITVKGQGAHGAMPHQGIDPVNVMVHIYLELQAIIAREIDTYEPVVMTVGSFHAGKNYNIIPDKAVMEGSIRSMNPAVSTYTRARICEIANKTAEAFRAGCEVHIDSNPTCFNEKALTEELMEYATGSGLQFVQTRPPMVSEDFAAISACVPSCFIWLGAGGEEDFYKNGVLHDPAVRFNEKALVGGASILASSAYYWLEKHSI